MQTGRWCRALVVGIWSVVPACQPVHIDRVRADGAVEASAMEASAPDDAAETDVIAKTAGTSPNGTACEGNYECASSFCVDGVCCEDACTGMCRSCGEPGGGGHCTLAAAGSDPRLDCAAEDVSTCGRTGSCDGAGRCALAPAGIVCRPPRCAGTQHTVEMTCDGNGQCATGGEAVSCEPYLCGTAADCPTSCTSDAECTPGHTCNDGVCGLRPVGATCQQNTECSSGFCGQGRCCTTACDGTCFSCAVAGREGVCSAVPDGEDPLDQCGDSGAATCGTDGACDGAGACRLHAAGTSCAAAMCNGSTLVQARSCDGTGTCASGQSTSCAPYACSAGACRTSCTTSNDCAAPAVCYGTACDLPGTLHVDYAALDTATSTPNIRPWVRIGSTGPYAVPLAELEMRYWYHINLTRAHYVECTSAAVGCAKVITSVEDFSPERTQANAFIRITFAGTAGKIAAGGNSDVVLRAWQQDNTATDQTNDYSFDATKTALTAWSHVTLYRNGVLVWGTEP